VTTKLSIGQTVLASTGPELIGAHELSYLTFYLSSRGATLLSSAKGNQLGARASLTQSTTTASAGLVLSRF
jgi:hypothetical protein